MSQETPVNGGHLPESYGNWHIVYTRMHCWSRNGVLHRRFEGLQRENIIKVNWKNSMS